MSVMLVVPKKTFKITDLIIALSGILAKHGDLEVLLNSLDTDMSAKDLVVAHYYKTTEIDCMSLLIKEYKLSYECFSYTIPRAADKNN